MNIDNFQQINNLYHNGINLCKGCCFEKNASCAEDRFLNCTMQYQRNSDSIKEFIDQNGYRPECKVLELSYNRG